MGREHAKDCTLLRHGFTCVCWFDECRIADVVVVKHNSNVAPRIRRKVDLVLIDHRVHEPISGFAHTRGKARAKHTAYSTAAGEGRESPDGWFSRTRWCKVADKLKVGTEFSLGEQQGQLPLVEKIRRLVESVAGVVANDTRCQK